MRDDIARMPYEKAQKVREEYAAHLSFQRDHIVRLKARRDRLMKKLDEEIDKVAADIQETVTVIDEIDKAHFKSLDEVMDEVLDTAFDECF